MPPDIEGLLKLQQRDTRLQELRKELERIPREKAQAESRLAQHEEAVDRAKASVNENEMAIKSVELDIETRKNSIARLKQQQFETRKNEEYQALGVKATHYSSEIDALETRELELMERGDELASTRAEAQAALATTREGVDEELAVLDKRTEVYRREVEKLEAERTELAAKLDEDVLSIYDRLLKLRGAPVVVQITGERQCLGCHVKATPATMVRVQSGRELVNCENCGRILYPE